ncbi:NAD(P)H dehydrogenase (quinone) [Albimonas donghaensis]|uniref:NAD(P)H dehydrogenase (Quinone) n=1 Tax=Albimonas donghaensis TaxID=356660 RepID=A0A1H2WG51_9RHOB|nr:NAD(P)H-binding protein [Albimonas donghaensis]SDW79234.1 NAD(P)H dehydrogenase (quinone) [Albimonas donghaensis]
MIVITAAAGQLGRLVLDALIARGVPAEEIVAGVRFPDRATDLAAKGVRLREADYDRPETLTAAFEGADRLLLISSPDIGRRAPQHQAAIDAARAAGVGLVAYTSILNAPTSPLMLAEEHRATEAALAASGLPHILLRNGWYAENLVPAIAAAPGLGAIFGAAGTGRIAPAARADYAEAAAAALIGGEPGRAHELAGAPGFDMAGLAAQVAEVSGQPVVYTDLPQADYAAALEANGLPGPLAAMLADSDAGAAKGGLDGPGAPLEALIGRPATPMSVTIRAALGV